jgi:hypothetical protein
VKAAFVLWQCGQSSEICGIAMYPYSNEISSVLSTSVSAARKAEAIFASYSALQDPEQEAFVVALIGELLVTQARLSAIRHSRLPTKNL